MVLNVPAEITLAPEPAPPGLADLRRRPTGRPDRLRHRTVLVVGSDGAFAGPAVTSPVAGLATHLAARAGAVTLLTGLSLRPDGRADRRYRFGLTFRETPRGPASPHVTRLRHDVAGGRTPTARLAGDLVFAARCLLTPLGGSPDLVVAVTPGPGGALAAARLAGRHGVPLLVVVQDLLGGDPGRAASTLTRLERAALNRATRVAVVSEPLWGAVRDLGVPPDRIVLLPQVTEPAPVVDRLTARRRCGWRQGSFLVAVPDPLSPTLDLATVLEAGRRLGPRAELVLLAPAGDAGRLTDRVGGRPRVHVAEAGDAPARSLVLAAADVLVVGDERRAAPRGLMECFRAGRPVVAAVAADGAAAHELTLSRGAGIVVRPGEPGLLAGAIGELRRDEALRTAMGGAGRLHAHHLLDRGAALLALDALVDAL